MPNCQSICGTVKQTLNEEDSWGNLAKIV
jgi:hypothetical protein